MHLVYIFVSVVLFAPFFWGSVSTLAVAILLLVVAMVAARVPGAWLRGPRITVLSLYAIVAAFAAIVGLQLLTDDLSLQPNGIWSLAGEVLERELPARAAVDLRSLLWDIGPVILYALTFWVALAIGSDRLRAEAILQWSVWGAATLVALTFFVYLKDEQLLLWSERIHHVGSYTHGFINRNSAASFLGTFDLLAIGLLVRSVRKLRPSGRNLLSPDAIDDVVPTLAWRVMPLLLAVVIFTVGLSLTASRAGILLTGLSAIFLIVLIQLKSPAGSKIALWTGGILTVLALWSLYNWGGTLSERLASGGLDWGARGAVYTATTKIITDYPLLGVGLGGFAVAFPAYRPISIMPDKIYAKAHNTLLEIAAEMGLPFTILLGLFWIGLFVVLIRGARIRRQRYFYPAIGAAVWLLATLHSMVDFPLQIPGHTVAVAAILGVCIAQSARRHRRL